MRYRFGSVELDTDTYELRSATAGRRGAPGIRRSRATYLPTGAGW